MKKIKITDANGKEFEVTMSDITDMTTDLEDGFSDFELSDAEKATMAGFTPSIVDSSGQTVNIGSILDEAGSDASRLPKAIDVQFEATHSGRNRNSFIYHSESMEKDAASWMEPFPKPFLKNHNMNSEPMGRVVDFDFGQSQFNSERDTINVTYRITDADAVAKFLDGRYRTMSIGGAVGHVSCSVCGKDILKDGEMKFCGHWRGETYNGQKAYWHGRDIEYKEGSAVNSPADDWAQVKKITIVTEENKAKDATDMADQANPLIDNHDEDILDIMDHLTDGADDPAEGGQPDEKDNEDTQAADTARDGGDAAPASEDEGGEQATLDSLTAERDSLKDANAQLTADKEVLEGRVVDLEAQVNNLVDEVETLKQEKDAKASDAQTMRQQSIKLAVMNKKVLAERAMDFERLAGNLADDAREARANELIAMSAKDLSALVDGLDWTSVTASRATVASVTNPGLVDHEDPNAVLVGDAAATAKEEPTKTMKDFEDTLINFIMR